MLSHPTSFLQFCPKSQDQIKNILSTRLQKPLSISRTSVSPVAEPKRPSQLSSVLAARPTRKNRRYSTRTTIRISPPVLWRLFLYTLANTLLTLLVGEARNLAGNHHSWKSSGLALTIRMVMNVKWRQLIRRISCMKLRCKASLGFYGVQINDSNSHLDLFNGQNSRTLDCVLPRDLVQTF